MEGTGSFPGVKGIAEAPCSLRSGTRVGVLAGAPVDIPCLTPLSRLLLSSCGRGSHRWLSWGSEKVTCLLCYKVAQGPWVSDEWGWHTGPLLLPRHVDEVLCVHLVVGRCGVSSCTEISTERACVCRAGEGRWVPPKEERPQA